MSSHWTRITNDVMDGVGLMEGLINSIKPLYFVVASITIKVRITAQKTKYQPIACILRIPQLHLKCRYHFWTMLGQVNHKFNYLRIISPIDNLNELSRVAESPIRSQQQAARDESLTPER